jgi:transcriptional regulator with XRE-family HTH domain
VTREDLQSELSPLPTLSQAFGAALRELRLERGLTQEDVAFRADLDRAYFGRLERAGKVPTLTTIWKLSVALGARPSELLARVERLLDR